MGMAMILGIFDFGLDQRLTCGSAVVRALDNTVNWLLALRARAARGQQRVQRAPLRPRDSQAGYYAHCTALDRCVGDLLRTEESIRGPFLLRYPQMLGAGGVCTAFALCATEL